MENNVIYDRLTETSADSNRLGKFDDAAFVTTTLQKPSAPFNAQTNPYIWSTKIADYTCPSFSGDEDVTVFGDIPTSSGSKVAIGNYMAIAATHYRSTPKDHLESGLPAAAGPDSGHDCSNRTHCGNGALPFPGIVDGKVHRTGLSLADLEKGTSKTAILTESREEILTSWYSGLASYVVAAMPQPTGATPIGAANDSGKFYWTCVGVPNCATALNQGDPKSSPPTFYQPSSPHGSGPRIYGPSSRHPGVVVHGFGDAHTEVVNQDIDADVYLSMCNRYKEQ
jgi:hypothetical protein